VSPTTVKLTASNAPNATLFTLFPTKPVPRMTTAPDWLLRGDVRHGLSRHARTTSRIAHRDDLRTTRELARRTVGSFKQAVTAIVPECDPRRGCLDFPGKRSPCRGR